ncbi:hypothetical protein M2322_002831 [Rhodoblastus acidophilus]|uniref:hypothetical protein n=1 Tax=Rhodoblastus acidophilus TaxID=1074 RepID=UPI002224DAE1|nr:hypothetical protein [Rhodoblastus acidophilus]MCW2317272.1 hypothetical protein [Rhodoblastus acidophilus]
MPFCSTTTPVEELMKFKTGLKAPRLGAHRFMFRSYAGPALPKRPAEFGHDKLVSDWHMLGNDRYGCCAWSGAAHEEYLWSAEAGQRVQITTQDVLADYAACTGFNPHDPNSDQGTDLDAAAEYRRKTGILDANGKRHKIVAYANIDPHDLEAVLTASWLFGAVGLGVTVGQNQETQFEQGKPWDGNPGADAGGHYVPLIAYHGGLFWVVTWGRLQAVTRGFLEHNFVQAMTYVSPDMMRSGKSLEGFNLAALLYDITSFQA